MQSKVLAFDVDDNVMITRTFMSSNQFTTELNAGLLGRVPVESVVAARHRHWMRDGFHGGSATLCVSLCLNLG